MIFARRLVCVSISVLLAVTGIFLPSNVKAADAGTTLKATNYSVPGKIYIGSPVTLKGIVSSKYKIKKVRIGIKNSKKRWLVGKNVTVKPKKKKFNIKTVDTKIKFGKLKAGVYYYVVTAKDSSGSVSKVIEKKFTVSEMEPMYYNTPSYYMIKGHSFNMKGKVHSRFKMTKVRIGITNSKGAWKTGFNQTVNPKSTKFNIASVDTKIKFGKLPTGTYKYVIYAKDNKGIQRVILSKPFKVVKQIPQPESGSGNSVGVLNMSEYTRLKYDASLINKIGAQQFSGPCGLYCMAYCRAILDGKFSKSGYDTYYEKMYYMYGLGSNSAYWSRGGGDCYWFTTAKSSYVRALREVKNGRPCIIKVHNGYSGNNHYVTVIGYKHGTTESNVSLNRLMAIDPVYCRLLCLGDISWYSDTSTPQCIIF